MCFTDHASRIWFPDCSKLAINRKNDNDITIRWHDVIVTFFYVAVFLLSSLVTGPSFMLISLLVLEFWQFIFIRDWPEIQKSEMPLSAIYFHKGLARNPEIRNAPVWVLPNIWRMGELGLPNLARMSLMKSYWMLQNATVTAFSISELLRENQQGVKLATPLPPPSTPHPHPD